MPDDDQRLADARDGFAQAHGREAAAVAYAPGRVNLIGEHTDYNGGLVLPIAIDMGTTCAAAPREDEQIRIVSTAAPESVIWAPGRPLGGWAAYVVGSVLEACDRGWWAGGVDIWLHGEVPLGAGLSSSAALECAVLTAICALGPSAPTPMDVALAAQRAENVYAGVPCGVMDQAASTHGAVDHAVLLDCATLTVELVPLRLQSAGWELLLIDSGVRHAHSDNEYAERRASCELVAAELGVPNLSALGVGDIDRVHVALEHRADHERLLRRARHVLTENDRVRAAVAAFEAADAAEIGRLFAASHWSMARDFEVTCPEVDVIVEAAYAGGALAARMTGGGFGGSVIAIVAEGTQPQIEAAVRAAYERAAFTATLDFRTVRAARGAHSLT